MEASGRAAWPPRLRQAEQVVDRVELVGWVKAERSSGAGPTRSTSWRCPRGPLPGELADLGLSMLGDSDSAGLVESPTL